MNMEKMEVSYIKEFRTALERGIEAIHEAARIYVEAIDRFPEAKDLFINSLTDKVPPSAWASFEAVGRKQMHPKLLFGTCGNLGAIKKLPYSDQDEIMAGKKFDLLTTDGDSILVDPRTVSSNQIKVLIGGNRIRTLHQQRIYIESLKNSTEKSKSDPSPNYVITSGKVWVQADTILTKREVKNILEAMR